MILVTVGTNEQPFDRLVRAAASLGGTERLVVQHGSSRVTPGRGEWVDFLAFDELAALAGEARIVVCHAGVGSIVLARRSGRQPVVMPRRHRLGEAVDDHQVSLAGRLSSAGLITTVEDAQALAAAVSPAADFVASVVSAAAIPDAALLPGPRALSGEVRSVLAGFGTGVRARGLEPAAFADAS